MRLQIDAESCNTATDGDMCSVGLYVMINIPSSPIAGEHRCVSLFLGTAGQDRNTRASLVSN